MSIAILTAVERQFQGVRGALFGSLMLCAGMASFGCGNSENDALSSAGVAATPKGAVASEPARITKPALRPTDILTTGALSRLRVLESQLARPAAPGMNVTSIRAADPGLVRVKSDGRVALRAFAPQGTPVIFRTTDGGRFVGGSTIVEVTADGTGVATATFWATQDATGYVDITAMSPRMSGIATFAVEIER